MTRKITNYIALMRVHQYLKNLFIFVPLFFAGRITESAMLLESLTAFASFSLAASAIYIFNDFNDREEDRKHPVKRHRPLASGTVGNAEALTLGSLLFICGIALSLAEGSRLFLIITAYIALNVSYTLKIKHVAVADVVVIAIGFVLRLYAGSVTTGVKLSVWIVVMTFLLAVFLALAKRRDDLLIFLEGGAKPRKVLDGYSMDFLNSSMVIMSAVVIVSYIMYTVSPELADRVRTDNTYLTSIFVVMGVMRYLQAAFVYGKAGSPTMVLIKDKFLQTILAGWVLSFAFILYG